MLIVTKKIGNGDLSSNMDVATCNLFTIIPSGKIKKKCICSLSRCWVRGAHMGFISFAKVTSLKEKKSDFDINRL